MFLSFRSIVYGKWVTTIRYPTGKWQVLRFLSPFIVVIRSCVSFLVLLISGIHPVVVEHFLDVKANVVGFYFLLNCIDKLFTWRNTETIKMFLWTCHFVLFCLRMPKLTKIQDLTAIFLSCYFLVVLTPRLTSQRRNWHFIVNIFSHFK